MNPSANHTATPAGIIGMPGWFASEQVAGFDRNRWLVSSEYAIERYITVPIEVGLSGMPNLAKVRSTSLFGLSVVSAQFTFAFNYEQSLQQVLNRLGQLNGMPPGVQPSISPWSPIGEILRYRVTG